jgi:hypothetical protein
MSKMNKEEVVKMTSAILKRNEADLGYITQEMVESDSQDKQTNAATFEAASGEDKVKRVFFGNNARYGTVTINGQNWQCYYFEGNNPPTAYNTVCATTRTWYLLLQAYDHTYLGKCNSGREAWRFDEK